MRCYFPRDVYSNIRNEFSQRCYLISDRGRYVEVWGAMRYCIVGVHSAESRVSPPRLRIEPDCKFISGQSPPVRGCTYAQLFLLFVYFFLDETRLSPFVLKWTSCHYTPCYCYFFWRFYRVLRREGVPFGKMFVLRASWRVCVATTSTTPIQNVLWDFHFISEFNFIVRLLK